MSAWLKENAWWLSGLFAVFVAWCRFNYQVRMPPAPTAAAWRWALWRLGEFVALTPWPQVGFEAKPLAALGRAYPEVHRDKSEPAEPDPPPSPGPPSLPPDRQA